MRMPGDGKTEKATPKRREDERKKGNILQSKDATNILGLVILTFGIQKLAPLFFTSMKQFMANYLSMDYRILEANGYKGLLWDSVSKTMLFILPLPILATVAAVAFTLLQTRMNFAKDQIKFKFSRVNLFKGLQNLISIKSLAELVKSMVKIATIAYILFTEIKAQITVMMRFTDTDILQAVSSICSTIITIVYHICIALAGFAIFDYVYQWWFFERSLRMTKQEIKDENKQIEGDPLIKSKIKERQRSMANMRMMEKVPSADLIIRNPTHYAVAIKYDPEDKKQRAPVVVAKGQGFIALKIIEIGEKNGVTITENRPLARGLFEAVKLDHEIPAEFYQAVAEVLAFVYRMKKKNQYK